MRAEPDATAPGPSPVRSLDLLYRQEYLRLVRLAQLFVDEVGAAEDVVQDVFLAVSGRAELPDDIPAYLTTAVLNRGRSVLRRRETRRRFAALLPHRDVPPPSDFDALEAAIRGLPARQREVVVLRFYLDLSTEETARRLGSTISAVTTSVHRAITTLSRVLTQGDQPA